MVINITIYHEEIMYHNPFIYVGGDIHQVSKCDVDYLSLWEVKELVCDLRYVNDIRSWYNVGDNHQHVIFLDSDVELIIFFKYY